MWIYLIIFCIPVVFFFGNKKTINRSNHFLFLYLLFLALFVGFSDMLGGYDRYIYGEVFDTIADVTTNQRSYLDNNVFLFFPSEPGYIILNILLSYITENRYIFIFIYTLIIYTLLFISLKRYAQNYPLTLAIFLGLWFFFTFTYLRQVLGATIAWLGIVYVIERRFWKFLLVFLIAWSIHKSAIIFFPIYFIPIKKYPARIVLLVMAIALLIGLSPIPNVLFNAYGDSSIVEQQDDYSSSGSIRIAYLFEAFVFLYIILSQYKAIRKEKSEIVLLNIALIFCAILLIFARSENGGRLSWYYIIGLILTLSNIGSRYRKKSMLSFGLIFLSLFLYVRIYASWQSFYYLYPYKTFFTNGYRKMDTVHDIYEYDEKYDVEKLYRQPIRWSVNLKK